MQRTVKSVTQIASAICVPLFPGRWSPTLGGRADGLSKPGGQRSVLCRLQGRWAMAVLVERLHMASFKLYAEFNPPDYVDTRIDVYAYVVLGLASNVLLIDTGVGEGNEHIEHRFEPFRTPIDQELARVGLDRADITLIVNSHLHFDHCGNNCLFPRAIVFVQGEELATARKLGTRYTVPQWFDYDEAVIRPVSGDMEVLDGVTLMATPGHTPGHQSVLIETGAGLTLIAAQAAFTASEFVGGGDAAAQAYQGLQNEYLSSISRLKSIGADEVYFSHDTRAA
jgi:N-acyl homoserine lactone hydrolase